MHIQAFVPVLTRTRSRLNRMESLNLGTCVPTFFQLWYGTHTHYTIILKPSESIMPTMVSRVYRIPLSMTLRQPSLVTRIGTGVSLH